MSDTLLPAPTMNVYATLCAFCTAFKIDMDGVTAIFIDFPPQECPIVSIQRDGVFDKYKLLALDNNDNDEASWLGNEIVDLLKAFNLDSLVGGIELEVNFKDRWAGYKVTKFLTMDMVPGIAEVLGKHSLRRI